ncbi:prepilin-type N-terminal cleavage/methylation domain-containing protein [bacterium]|nr:prepilin-type N-terminal cleavage/methylation domain-containing protein [bacterium]MBU1600140.1 prepilin-type N-terminal cleavage/methylation domain-containing protein [bacterium]MBU2462050.1 prepilin-type N-terminal cleavage/methylation domain-containing protein [bacterium]
MERIKIKGYTLIEIMVTVVIIGITLLVVTPNLIGSIRRQTLESNLLGLSSDLKNSRADAMVEGTRTVTLIVGVGQMPQDFDEDGKEEHYITFIDNNRNGTFENGDRLLYRNNWGDVRVETNTLSPIVFMPQGTIFSTQTTPWILSIKFPNYESEYSLELLSIVGMTRITRIHL